MLYTKNQLSRLPESDSKCNETRMVVVVGFLTDNNATPKKVVLSCFGLLVELWQFHRVLTCYLLLFVTAKPQP
jgi:hypothetical protein